MGLIIGTFVFSFCLDPFRAPEPLPIPNPSSFVPKNGFPVVKGLTPFHNENGVASSAVDGGV